MLEKMNKEIKLIIKKKRLKQKELAAKLGISTSYLSEILNGRKDPSYRVFIDLCMQLKMCPYELGGVNNVSCDICEKVSNDRQRRINKKPN